MLFVKGFLSLSWRMAANFSETRAFTFKEHMEKRVWAFQNDQKNLLYSYYSGCFFGIFASKMLISDELQFQQKTFMAASSEACALTPGKCFAEESKNVRKRSEKHKNVWKRSEKHKWF